MPAAYVRPVHVRPVVYAQPTIVPRPVVVNYPPVYQPAVAAYAPAYVAPPATCAAPVGPRVWVHEKVYVQGQPLRNLITAITP